MGINNEEYGLQGLDCLHDEIIDFVVASKGRGSKTELEFHGCSVKFVLDSLEELGIDVNVKEFIGPQLIFNHQFTYNEMKFHLHGNAYGGTYTLRTAENE